MFAKSSISALAVILTVLTGASERGASAQPETDGAHATFRSGTSLVVIAATVQDRDGSYVMGLTANDFSVYEEGVRQNLSFFASEGTPVDLVIMIDTSSSMASRQVGAASSLDIARQAALTLIRSLDARDTAAIVGFGERTEVRQAFTANRTLLETAVAGLRLGGATSLYTSLYVALHEFSAAHRAQAPRRRAIVIVSDGEDTKSLVPYDAVIRLARQLNVAIYTVLARAAVPGSRGRRTFEADYEMRSFARETGGRSFFLPSMSAIDASYQQIGAELTHQYALAYTPAKPRPPGTFIRLTVAVNRPDVRVRARTGYLSGSSS